ncbi:MAG TPA: transposase, partial [Mycobacterium sp.]|nr:transposase [Mycobacterium sp.]
RAARKAAGGQVYHVLNRSVGKMHLFGKDADFEAFQRVMIEAHQRYPIRILSYCVLSNHWHFAVWPDADGQVTAFFRWLAHTHAMRWRVVHRTVGYGHLYQGRFQSVPVQTRLVSHHGSIGACDSSWNAPPSHPPVFPWEAIAIPRRSGGLEEDSRREVNS